MSNTDPIPTQQETLEPLTDREFEQMEQWAGAGIADPQPYSGLMKLAVKTDAFLQRAIQEIRGTRRAAVTGPRGDAADVLKVLAGRHHAQHHKQFNLETCPAWPCDILRAAATSSPAQRTRVAGEQWSKETPKVDGVYWWRMSENDPDPDICETDLQYGTVYDIGEPQGDKIAERGGEWLGPIAPETPVIMPVIDRAPRFTVTSDSARRAAEEIAEIVIEDVDLKRLQSVAFKQRIVNVVAKHLATDAAATADNDAESRYGPSLVAFNLKTGVAYCPYCETEFERQSDGSYLTLHNCKGDR